MTRASAQERIPLYEKSIPNSKTDTSYVETEQVIPGGTTIISNVSKPELIAYFPEKPNGTSVIIFPGGSYSYLAIAHEGTDVAKRLANLGITAFVVKYRLPNDRIMTNKSIGPLQDAQRAIQLVRGRAAGWKLDPAKIGIMGFSAGGHLASTAGTHFEKALIENKESISLRPDFMILVYPVISMDSTGHRGSAEHLLGPAPPPATVESFSNQKQVTEKTPPTFLVHAQDDQTVPVSNSLDFFEALKQHNVPSSINLYDYGGHGFGMNNKTTSDQWFERMLGWFKNRGLL